MQDHCACCFNDGCLLKLSYEGFQQIQQLTGDCCSFMNVESICGECQRALDEIVLFRQRVIETQQKFKSLSVEIKSEPPEDIHLKIQIRESTKEEFKKEPSHRGESNRRKKRRRKNALSKKDHFCPCCDKFFTEARKVKEHVRRVHERRKDFHCDHCDYSAYKKYDILLHITNVHKPKSSLPKSAVCPTCGLAFLTNSRLNIHIRRKHLKALTRRIACDLCGHRTATLNEMRCHMKVHCSRELRERYRCGFCEAAFYSKGSLKTHKDVKHLLTDFEIKCFCGKVFKQKSVYQRHYDVIHLGQKPFKCPYPACGKAFSGKTHLDYHKRAAHSSVVSAIPCEVCGALYKSLETLKRHRIYHSEPKFRCSECGRMFHENKKLMDHQSIHTTLEFACTHCDKSFRLETQLNYHLKKAHFREKLTFKCELCLSSFTRKSTYRDHALRQHKELSEDDMSEFLKRIRKSLSEEHKCLMKV